MTIPWSDAAIEAAIRGWFDTDDAFRPRMRAALNAAVQAQGDLVVPYDTFRATMAGVRADALEEAARACEGDFDSEMRAYGKGFAADIRALKEKGGEQ